MKFALRQLLRNPGFAAVAILTLALGIGANTAIFSVLHAVVLRPFQYPEAERIVFVSVHDRDHADSLNSLSYPDLLDYAAQNEVFEHFGGALDGSIVVSEGPDPARVKGCCLSPEIFSLLRTPPLLGRVLLPSDNQREAERVCVLSFAAWQRFLSGAPDVLGRTITLDGRPHAVVGVMPDHFKFWNAQVYVPLIHGVPRDIGQTRAATIGIWGVGRLKHGVTLEQANANLDTVAHRLAKAYPDSNRTTYAQGRPLVETVSQQIRPTLLMLFGAVGFVLLIACVNVTNLMLARGATRVRELAVRSALGASRGRVFRQLLAETLPLALAGAALGIALAAGGLKVLLGVIPENLIPAEANVRLSLPVLGFTLVTSLFAAVLAGVLPAIQSSRLDLNEALKEGARGSSDRKGGRVREALVVAEVALALTLLIGAGLLTRDLARLLRIDPGFRVEGLVVARLDLPEVRYAEPARGEAFVRTLLERVRVLPGVERVGIARSAPLSSGAFNIPLMIFGKSYARLEDMENLNYNPLAGDALATLGARLVAGRPLNDQDRGTTERVVVLNEAAVKKFFPDGQALGRQVVAGIPANLAGQDSVPPELIDPPWATVVGIASDVRQFGFLGKPQPEMYLPFEQSFKISGSRNQFYLLVRTPGSPETVIPSLRQALRELEPNVPTDAFQTMASLVRESTRPQRFVAWLLGIFAGVAGFLAVIGIYSVVSWTVAQRTREVGIRMALGATPTVVVSRLVRLGLVPVLLGVGLGLLIALALAQVMTHQLAEVPARDPLTYAGVALLLTLVAVVACWLPARRAAKVDPMVTLRAE